MIVDSSAVLAILFRELDYQRFDQAVAESESCRISTVTFVEVSIVVEARGKDRGLREWDAFFREAAMSMESVTEEQAFIARQAYSDYGKGRHPANLNFGDCFAYALAKAMDEPLLFKGDDFAKTDVRVAL